MNVWAPHSWGEMTLEEGFASKEDMAKFEEEQSIVSEIIVQITFKDGKWYWRKV